MKTWFKSIVLFVFAFVLFAFACAARAQAVDFNNSYTAGVSFNGGASAPVAGTLTYEHKLADNTQAFTVVDILPATVKPFTVTTNVGFGVAQKVLTIKQFPVFIPTTAGPSVSGSNVGWAWTTGGATIFKPKQLPAGWFLMPTVRVLKSSVSGGSGYQPIFGLQIGIGQ